MTGSFLVPIITPIVAVLGLACWMGMIFWADAHPGWKTHHAAGRDPAPESQLPVKALPPLTTLEAAR
jgi:hypothetical protein